MHDDTLTAYLDRIGATRPARADAAALAELHERHLRTVPFENLSIHLGEPIELDPAWLVDKIVHRRRGGFCYELNGAFAALLTALGYRVDLLAASVHGDDGPGFPFDHLALAVTTVDGDRLLADVGFGRHTRLPLRFDVTGPQTDPDGTFELRPTEHGDLDVIQDGTPQYRLETRPRALSDFVAGCWYNRTSPDSHFTRSLTCSRLTGDGRVTLSGQRLIRTVGEHREERTVPEPELLTTYRELFGIELDRVPEVS